MAELAPDALGVTANDETAGADDPARAAFALHDGLPQFVRGEPREVALPTVLAGAVSLPRLGGFVVPAEAGFHLQNPL